MNFLTISELLNAVAGFSNDPFICQRIDELDAKLGSIRTMLQLHQASGTPSNHSIVEVLRHELREV